MSARKRAALLLAAILPFSAGCITAVAAFQPKNIGVPVLTLTTFDAEGRPSDRVLARLEKDGVLYLSVNHWPRGWYYRALQNPEVQVTEDGETRDYLAVPVSEAEHDQLVEEFGLPFVARIFTGFAPRAYLRLDPR